MTPLLVGLVLFVTLLAVPALAQDAGTDAAVDAAAAEIAAPPAPSQVQLEEELAAVRDAMQAAVNARDLDALLAHVDEHAIFTAMDGEVARGHEGIRAYFARMVEGDAALVRRIETRVDADQESFFFGDTAIASGTAHDHYELSDGRVFDVDARWSSTLRREEGGWKVLSLHYSTNVFDNPVLEAQRDVMTYVTIGTGVVSGLAFFLLGRISARTKAQSA